LKIEIENIGLKHITINECLDFAGYP